MGYRDKRERYRSREELNRGDYRGDFGPEGSRRFDSRDDRRDQRHARGQSHHESGARWDERRYAQSAGDWRWRHSGREGWQRERGYGRGYDYPHDQPEQFVATRNLPDALGDARFYEPGEQGAEREIAERLRKWRERKKKG